LVANEEISEFTRIEDSDGIRVVDPAEEFRSLFKATEESAAIAADDLFVSSVSREVSSMPDKWNADSVIRGS
jgi:hypothetical protein